MPSIPIDRYCMSGAILQLKCGASRLLRACKVWRNKDWQKQAFRVSNSNKFCLAVTSVTSNNGGETRYYGVFLSHNSTFHHCWQSDTGVAVGVYVICFSQDTVNLNKIYNIYILINLLGFWKLASNHPQIFRTLTKKLILALTLLLIMGYW